MTYTVRIQIETNGIVRAAAVQEEVAEEHLAFMLAGLPLAYSLPLNRQLRDNQLTPREGSR